MSRVKELLDAGVSYKEVAAAEGVSESYIRKQYPAAENGRLYSKWKYPQLRKETIKRGLRREDLAAILLIKTRTLDDKLQGRSNFTPLEKFTLSIEFDMDEDRLFEKEEIK